MPLQPIIPLLQRAIARNRLPHNSRLSLPLIGLPLTCTQIANFVWVTHIKRSDAKQSFAVKVIHRLPPSVLRNHEQKTYDVDVILADGEVEHDVKVGDVCWRFQVLEGENELDRRVNYAQAFGKHGSGDEDFDEYVRAFQGEVTGRWFMGLVAEKEGDWIKCEDMD